MVRPWRLFRLDERVAAMPQELTMLFHDPTPAVTRALAAARDWAVRRGRATVGPRELLLGLLEEPEGRPAVLLERFGLNLGSWAAPTPRTPVRVEHEIPFDAAADRVCRQAQQIARTTTEDHICTTDHVLLAVLEHALELRTALSNQGLDVPALERELHGEHAESLAIDAPLDWTEAGESFDAARILDANANRAREALRVLEDYCRFVLSDALLSRELKELRHGLVDALAVLPGALLLAARDTESDVGTAITTPREQERYALRDVVAANLKRLQESLRTLEEYGKLRSADLGMTLESLRYRTYTLERILASRDREGAGGKLAGARLYVLLSATTCRASLEWTIAEAAAGGADVVQLREKSLPDRALLERARDVRRWTHKAGVLFIVNDRPDIARLADADGVHLGQDDLPVREARRVVGPDALVGVSTHTLEQVRQAVRDGASYIGVGPTFPSTTKEFDQLAGLDFVRAATAETSLPAFVLGGVTAKNVSEVVAAGGRRVAVSAAISRGDDPRAAASALRRAVIS
jgi:thiamine-phosphate pyrophosphorylase